MPSRVIEEKGREKEKAFSGPMQRGQTSLFLRAPMTQTTGKRVRIAEEAKKVKSAKKNERGISTPLKVKGGRGEKGNVKERATEQSAMETGRWEFSAGK